MTNQVPALITVKGHAVALSTDVAAYFGKRHNHVIRDIENLLSQLGEEHLLNFEEMLIDVVIGNGAVRKSRAFYMNRDGFTLLAMGFTGSKALQFKLAYIDAFNKMEAELSSRHAKPEFQIPQTFSEALRLAADLEEQRAIEEQKRLAAESALAVAEPKAVALERISVSSGSLCITDAAKVLQVKPKELFQHLSAQKWIYKRGGVGTWIAFQDKIQGGFLEQKVTSVSRNGTSDKVVEQCRVTTKGLSTLAQTFKIKLP